jgi:endonuclease/exonuclease/phosphatase family metal-dependent hydrolase
LKVLSFNAGLLDVRLAGFSVLRPAASLAERFASLPAALRALDADILLLQEIYEPGHKSGLVAQLQADYPFNAVSPLRGPSLVPASLLTLSKHPLRSLGFHRFRHMPLGEKLLDNKGFLLAEVDTPAGALLTANVHTTAGGSRHPEHPRSDAIRGRQIAQLLTTVQLEQPVLLAGDLNCGTVSPSNYAQLMGAGYADLWPLLRPGDTGWTWDPDSVLNRGGTHTAWGCPAQRIDLLLLNAKARARFSPVAIDRVFENATVPVAGAESVTLSDHYGVCATLRAIT